MLRSVVVSDNASNNDSCVATFFARFNSNLTRQDIKARRIRCFGHILNLIAKAFLSGLDFDSSDPENPQDTEADLQFWRKTSPITRLHNIVKYIRASPQRSQAFKDLSKELEAQFEFGDSTADLEVKSINETQWNSTYLMIERAVRKQEELTAYIALEKSSGNGLAPTDHLTDNDWKRLSEVMNISKPIHELTMRTQGRGAGGGLWDTYLDWDAVPVGASGRLATTI